MSALGPRVRNASPRASPRKSPRFGPRMENQKFKERMELGRTNYTYDDFKNGTPGAKIKILTARPDIALGKAAGKDIEEVQFRIYFIILASLIVAILTTVSYTTLTNEHKMGEYLVAAFSISWFIFISFIFLLFDATRLLHIIFFGVILGLISNVYHVLDKEEPIQNKKTQNIITATTVFAGAATIVLLYYYLTSRKEDELVELKTKEKMRQHNEDIAKLVKKAKDQSKEEIKEEFKEKYRGVDDINTRVINKFLTAQTKKDNKKDNNKKDNNKKDDDDS